MRGCAQQVSQQLEELYAHTLSRRVLAAAPAGTVWMVVCSTPSDWRQRRSTSCTTAAASAPLATATCAESSGMPAGVGPNKREQGGCKAQFGGTIESRLIQQRKAAVEVQSTVHPNCRLLQGHLRKQMLTWCEGPNVQILH